ncbi:hypothetical protein BDN72DRAFT_902473 [Pluteus cervinus]|uniref:Uncharacterized protein n=1 Tax=Pluteus cervinus TaxID=181527 RepID=A0ACD3AD69_9AGAR|nr:hypothetical protein BDN72DRAFT_902473 [Pluteus cervinus]
MTPAVLLSAQEDAAESGTREFPPAAGTSTATPPRTCTSPMYHPWHDIFLWTSIFVGLFTFARAALVNRTIDDTLGDPITNFRPLYAPTTGAWEDASCSTCFIQPSKDLAFDGTWTAATFRPEDFSSMSVQLQFTGVAIYVFFILANNQGVGTTTRTVSRFLLDGAADTTFIHEPTNSTDLQYNSLAYAKTGLSNATHTVTMLTDTSDPNIAPTEQIFVNFDYAIYTVDDGVPAAVGTPSSSSGAQNTAVPSATATKSKGAPVAAIAGAIVGVVLLAVIAGLVVYYLRKRKRERFSDKHLGNPPLSPYSDHNHAPLPPESRPLYGADGELSQAELSGSAASFGRNPVISVSSRPSYGVLGAFNLPSQPRNADATISASSISYAHPPGGSHTSQYGQLSATGLGPHITSTIATPTLQQPSLTEGTSTQPSLSTDQSRASRPAGRFVVTNNSHDDGVSIREIRQQELGRKVAEVQRELTGRVAVVQQRSSNTSEMAELRAQVNQLREQLGHLQTQQQSPWALGLSDDPPPGYTPGY